MKVTCRSFLLVDTFGPEELAEGLPRKQRSAGDIRVEIERRLGGQRDKLGRPVDGKQRTSHRPPIRYLDDDGTGWHSGQCRQEAFAVIIDLQKRRRQHRIARYRHGECGLRLHIDARKGARSQVGAEHCGGAWRQIRHAPNEAAQNVNKALVLPG